VYCASSQQRRLPGAAAVVAAAELWGAWLLGPLQATATGAAEGRSLLPWSGGQIPRGCGWHAAWKPEGVTGGGALAAAAAAVAVPKGGEPG